MKKMRYFAAALAVLSLAGVCMTGCSPSKKEMQQVAELSKKGNLEINGKSLDMPIAYKSFTDDGWKDTSSDSFSVAMENDKYKDVRLVLYSSNQDGDIDQEASGIADIKSEGAYGLYVYNNKEDSTDKGLTGSLPVEFPGKIEWDSDYDDIVAYYGKPDAMNTYEGTRSLYYDFSTDDITAEVMFTLGKDDKFLMSASIRSLPKSDAESSSYTTTTTYDSSGNAVEVEGEAPEETAPPVAE